MIEEGNDFHAMLSVVRTIHDAPKRPQLSTVEGRVEMGRYVRNFLSVFFAASVDLEIVASLGCSSGLFRPTRDNQVAVMEDRRAIHMAEHPVAYGQRQGLAWGVLKPPTK
jgi:hypothetical protein